MLHAGHVEPLMPGIEQTESRAERDGNTEAELKPASPTRSFASARFPDF